MRLEVAGHALLGELRQVAIPAEGWEELEACPVCGRAEAVIEVGRIEPGGAVTAACTACEHGFLRRRPTTTWLADYYAREWDRAGRARTVGGAPAVRPDDKIAAFVADRLPPGAAVMDVGAGFGHQLLAFRDRGYVAHGLEASEHRAQYVRRLGIPCTTDPVDEARAPEDLELAFSHHVLEHVPDPHRFIAAQVALLGGDGLVAVAVPSLWHELPPQCFHYVGHLSLFTRRSLHRLLAGHGLRMIEQRETFELLALAERGDPAPEPPGDPRFAARLASWAARPFGGAGRHAVVWRKARTSRLMYQDETASTWRAHALAVRATLARRARGPLRRIGDTSLRMLDIKVTDAAKRLPITIVHNAGGGVAWIK